MKNVCLFVCLFVCLSSLNAQECGFEPPENYETFELEEQARIASTSSTIPENYCVNVCFRIVRDDNGTNAAIDPSILPQVMTQLNTKFNPHGITFVQIGTFEYLNNTTWNTYTYTPSTAPVNRPNCLNIYFIKTFQGQTTLSGIASYGTLRATIKGSHALLNNTTAHEVGHALNLLHTFNCTSPYNASCYDNPTITNDCTTKGDQICDTPEDYNPLSHSTASPPFLGYASYNPDINNIMSQWSNTVYFSAGQAVRAKAAISNGSQLQPIRSYQCAQINGTERICPYAFDELNQIIVPTYTFSVPNYGSGNTFTWSIIGNSNLQFVSSNSSNSVQITNSYLTEGLDTATLQVVINTSNGSFTLTKNVITICYIRRVVGLFDWVSVDYGVMGLIAPFDNQNTFVTYKWEITEDESRVSLNQNKTKPQFVGASINNPFKFTSNTNQAVVNWGNASSSYLVTCYGVEQNGAEVLLNYSYVDVGDPKNNPCFKDAITTVVAPNPIQNDIIQVVVNKPSHTTPCNYKDLNEPQFFNSEIDEINNSISIFDYSGNEVYRRVFETNEFIIDDAQVRSGNNYIVNLFTKEGGFSQQVIIVE
jgi:hypothetical protein